MCRSLVLLPASVLAMFSPVLHAADWPQWGGPQRDIVWRESGIIDRFPNDGLLPRMWSTPIAEGYSGPAVANGRVFITDYERNRATERVFCLDAEDGHVLWKYPYPARYDISYPNGPRATPLVDNDRVYTLGAVGNLICLKTNSGTLVWKKDFTKDFGTTMPTWGTAAAPLIDGDQLIALVGGKNNSLVVSLDKRTGRELWRSLDDPGIGYCPPVIHEFGGVRQLIVWHPSAVSSISPSDGTPIWEIPFPVRFGLSVPMPRRVGNRLFVTAFFNGPLMIKVADDGRSAEIEWRGRGESEKKTDGLHSIMPTPWVTETHIYGVCSYGQLRCLNVHDGTRIWETFAATGNGRWWNAFLIPQGNRFFLHNEQGDLIIARLTPDGYDEISRAKLVEPTRQVKRRMTIWSHPAFAMQSVFARNDNEIVRVDLSAK